MEHPDWYFAHYNKIFQRQDSEYETVVNKISEYIIESNPVIQEIGSGTGLHSSQLLKLRPKELHLLDLDEQAISITEKKFSDYSNVVIEKRDGFLIDNLKFDLVCCFYSVIQQNCSEDIFHKRILQLKNRIVDNGIIAFEIIDYDLSKNTYFDNSKNLVYKKDEDYVEISSQYHQKKIIVNFTGKIGSDIIGYTVDLLRINSMELSNKLKNFNLNVLCDHNLEKNGRRKLFICEKLANRS